MEKEKKSNVSIKEKDLIQLVGNKNLESSELPSSYFNNAGQSPARPTKKKISPLRRDTQKFGLI